MSTFATAPRTAPHRPADARQRSPRQTTIASNIDPIRVLRRHMLWIIGAAMFGGILGIAAFFLCSKYYPLYGAKVLFEVKPALQKSTDIGTLDMASDDMVFRIAQTETYLLTSRDVLDQAMKSPMVAQTTWYKQFTNDDGTPNVDAAIDELEEDLASSVVRGSNLFGLSWSTHVPAEAREVLNSIALAYMELRNQRDTVVYNKNKDAFAGRLAQTQTELENLALQIAEFIRNKNMMTLEGARSSATAFKIDELNEKLTEASQQLNITKSRYATVASKLQGEMEPSDADRLSAEKDPSLSSQADLVMRYKTAVQSLHNTVQPDSQQMIDMENRLRAAQDVLEQEIDQIITSNLHAQLKLLAENQEQMENVIEELEQDIERESTILKDLAANQSQYQAMVLKRENLEAQRTANLQLVNEVDLMRLRADAARVSLTQKARTPRELSFPQLTVMLPLGVLVMVGLTIGGVFLRELLDQRIKSASDVAVLPGAQVLGAIPEMDEDPTDIGAAELVVRKHPNSVLAESYRQAWTPIMRAIDRIEHQTVLLCSGLPGAGTTTVATNLAAAAAATGRKVAIVDANFRRPHLAQAMELPEDGPGFGDLLADMPIGLDEALVDAGGGVSVIAAGTPANRVSDRFNNGQFDRIMAELRTRFDLILFDAPPAVVAGDALVLANKVDAAVLVVRANQEHRGLVARLIHQLSDARCDLLGVLLNRPRGTAGGYFKKNYATMAGYSESKA